MIKDQTKSNESENFIHMNMSDDEPLRNFKSKREILENISWETEAFNIYNPNFSDSNISSESFDIEDNTLE